MRKFFKIFNIFNFWSYPLGVIYELREWVILRKAVKEDEVLKQLIEAKLRVDKLGRIYTVIPIDPELAKNPNTYWPAIIESLKPLNTIIAKIGLSELVFPRIERIDMINFLIVLEPEVEYLSFKKFGLEILKWGFLYLFFGTVNNILVQQGIDYLTPFKESIMSLLDFLPI